MRRARPVLGYAVTAAAVGAGLALLAGSRVWARTDVPGTGSLPRPPEQHTGTDLLPWLPALAVAAIAGAGALLATRGPLRAVVGGLLALCGLAIMGGSGGHAVTGDGFAWWPALAVVGGLSVLGAGTLTLLRGRSWPTMGARYQRPATPLARSGSAPAGGGPAGGGPADGGGPKMSPATMWDALDRGEDPTR